MAPPEDIQRLRDLTRLQQALRHDRTRWAQRLHAILLHEGWPCSRSQLLTPNGRRWLEALALDRHVRRIVDAHREMINVSGQQIAAIDRELRQLARNDARLLALQTIYGVGPVRPRRRARRSRDRVGRKPPPRQALQAGSPHLRWISWMGPPTAAIGSRPRQVRIDEGGPEEMVDAAIDIHTRVFQAAVLDAESGQLAQERLPATREALDDWATRSAGKLEAVALEATTGWRWVARELQARGFDVRLCDPGEARALGGSKRRPKTDRLDAAWLARLLAKEMLPEAWLPPAEIQYLRDRTRLRHALAQDRNRWAQRLHALLTHEGWPCGRGRLLTVSGQKWASALALPEPARASVEAMLTIIHALDEQIELLDTELRRLARSDPRLQALCAIFGVGPVLAAHILAELGAASRFRRARQVVRLSGLDPVVSESANVRRRGRLSKQGSPELRWALAEAAHHACRRRSPDHALYTSAKQRRGTQRATLTVARKIARRAYHVLADLEQAA